MCASGPILPASITSKAFGGFIVIYIEGVWCLVFLGAFLGSFDVKH